MWTCSSGTGGRSTRARPSAVSASCGWEQTGTGITSSGAAASSATESPVHDRGPNELPLLFAERPSGPCLSVVRHDHRLGFGRQLAVALDDLLASADARRAHIGSRAADHDLFVEERELAAIVDRDPHDHEVELLAEDLLCPGVAYLLQ